MYGPRKPYARFDRKALWNVQKIFGVGRQLLEGIKKFYGEASACVRMAEEQSENFPIGVGVRRGCVMPPWLFPIFMDGCMKEIKTEVVNVRQDWRSMEWVGQWWSAYLQMTLWWLQSEEELQRGKSMSCKVSNRCCRLVFKRTQNQLPSSLVDQCLSFCKINFSAWNLVHHCKSCLPVWDETKLSIFIITGMDSKYQAVDLPHTSYSIVFL